MHSRWRRRTLCKPCPGGWPAGSCGRARIALEGGQFPGRERRRRRAARAEVAQPLFGDDSVVELAEDVLYVGGGVREGVRPFAQGGCARLGGITAALGEDPDHVQLLVRR